MAKEQTTNLGPLSLPPGSEGVVLQDGELTRTMVRATDNLYTLWDYTPVHTPMADYIDRFAQSLGLSVPHHTYRFVDRDGQILSLRSDITLFLMKQIHHFLQGAKLPLRLCYSDSIFRHQDRIDIGKNEYFQTGAELFGAEGRDGDLEILCLLAETLTTLKVHKPVLHVGSRKLFALLWNQASEPNLELIARAISNRNWPVVEQLSQPVLGPRTSDLITLVSFIGHQVEISQHLKKPSVQGLLAHFPLALEELDHLIDLGSTLEKLFPQLDIRIDLSELGSQSYHSGIAFQVYTDGTDTALASGGRYDGLLASMGLSIPAVGFSLMLSKLLAHGSDSNLLTQTRVSSTSGKDDTSFEQRYQEAQQARAKGTRVSL